MSKRDEFEATCARLCQEQGWVFGRGRVEVKLGDGRHQVVWLEFFEFEEEELVRLYTTIGSRKGIGAAKLANALRLNFGLPHGALAVRDDQLVMIDTLLVEDADPGEIEASVAYLAETGDHFEKTMFGPDEH